MATSRMPQTGGMPKKQRPGVMSGIGRREAGTWQGQGVGGVGVLWQAKVCPELVEGSQARF